MKFIGEYIVKNYLTHASLAAVMLTTMFTTTSTVQADDLIESLKAGKVGGGLRIRYENVDQENITEEADALTARFNLKYTSGDFYNTYLLTEFEHVTDITDDFFDGPNGNGTAAGAFPAVIDPEGTDILQGFIGFKQIKDTEIKLGRQLITPRKAPFHRFLGNVLWRQKWSTYDAVTVKNTSLPNTTIFGGYIWNNVFITRQDRNMEAPFLNIKYDGFKYAKLEGYYYDFNFEDDSGFAGLGTETFGGRVSGAFPISDNAKLIYAGEYATQSESDDATTAYDADYYLAEGGVKFTFKDSFIKSLMAKVSYEVMETDGVGAFKTPLATGHAYFGWADQFLATPATAGIEDTYFTAVATGAYDTKLIVSYHMLEAETGGSDYGDEFNIWFTKKFAKKYTVGIKYADYSADSANTISATNDVSKFWTYFAFKF